MLVWRFGAAAITSRHARVEHIAVRLVGAALVISATYVAIQASADLANRSGPGHTAAGLALAGASVLVLPGLAYLKLRIARSLRSGALHADGALSAAGAGLAAAALLGLLLSDTLGWWWASAAAALLIAGALVREGWRRLSAPLST